MSELDLLRKIADLEARLARLESDDRLRYTTGTWTPSFAGTGTAGTFTYGNQLGIYTRVGNVVFFTAQVNITAIAVAPTGNMYMYGLPFSSAAAALFPGVAFGTIDHFNYSAGALQLTGRIGNSSSSISLYESFDNSATAAAPAANFTNANCNMTLSGYYTI